MLHSALSSVIKIYMYSWFTLLFCRNNINQLHSRKKFKTNSSPFYDMKRTVKYKGFPPPHFMLWYNLKWSKLYIICIIIHYEIEILNNSMLVIWYCIYFDQELDRQIKDQKAKIDRREVSCIMQTWN